MTDSEQRDYWEELRTRIAEDGGLYKTDQAVLLAYWQILDNSLKSSRTVLNSEAVDSFFRLAFEMRKSAND
jgi:hypothetical protein